MVGRVSFGMPFKIRAIQHPNYFWPFEIWTCYSSPHCKAIYSRNLKSGLVWISNIEKRLCCKWSKFWMGSAIWKPNHLKSGQMAFVFSKTIWNLDKNVRFSNGRDYSQSLSPTVWKLDHLKSDLQKVRISDPHSSLLLGCRTDLIFSTLL